MHFHSFFLLTIISVAACRDGASNALGPHGKLSIKNAMLAPDGFRRSTTIAQKRKKGFPGPLVKANVGDTISMRVENKLKDSSMSLETSIHWHGIFQTGTPFEDGASSVTQCPIIPGESFQYEYPVHKAGTFWYHSHFKAQYCDGLRGPMVIYDPNDPQRPLYDIDNEDTVITLADWYHYPSIQPRTTHPFNSTLINGKGRYPGGPAVPLAVVNVEPGSRYRFRVVSISCLPNFFFSIDGHQMTIIEVDGNNVQPLVVDSIQIFAGQRYSIVLNANKPVDNYWIRSLPNATGQSFTDLTNLAVLRYKGAPEENPSSDPTTNVPTSKLPLIETDLHPLVRSQVPGKPYVGGADININLDIKKNTAGTKWLVNDASFESPTVPVLLQILSGVQASDLLPKGSIYKLGRNMSVELTMPAGSVAGPHPVHLHGHSFYVVRSAGNSTYNFDNPVIRDVVSMGNNTNGKQDNVTIRFFTDNPGPWFFHCHIDWHLNEGFAVVFAEDVPDVPKLLTQVPGRWKKLCPVYNEFVNQTGGA